MGVVRDVRSEGWGDLPPNQLQARISPMWPLISIKANAILYERDAERLGTIPRTGW